MAFTDLAALLIPRFVIFRCSCFFEVSMFSCLDLNVILYTGSSPEPAEEILDILEVVCIPKTG